MCCLATQQSGVFTIQLTNSIIHELNNSRTHKLKNSRTHKLKNSITHQLKILQYFLQNICRLSLPSSEKRPQKHANRRYFQPFPILFLSVFWHITCILHHFAFLVWLPTHIFQPPNTHFLSLKSYFLTTILPFPAMCFMVLKGFVYTIAVDVYAFCLVFSSTLHCILHHFTLRLAPKRTAFSGILHCI